MIPSPPISSFPIGPFTIRFYALFILTGIVVAVLLTSRRLRARGYPPGATLDIALWAVPFGIVGARIYHVVTHPTDYFGSAAAAVRALYIWEGGIAIFGAVAFGAIGAAIGARRSGVPLAEFADAVAPGLLLAQAIGRLGNYFNQELYGTPTTLPWGLQIDPSSPAFPAGLPSTTLFHPLFLYELLWNIAGAGLILLAERYRRRRGDSRPGLGMSIGIYFIWYGAGRAWFESFRLDPTEWSPLGIKINVITAVAVAIFGAVLVYRARRFELPPPKPADDAAAPAEPVGSERESTA